MVLGGCVLDRTPKTVRNLEIIALVSAGVEEAEVASKTKIVINGIRSDGLFALPMQVGPIPIPARFLLYEDWIGFTA